MQFIDLKIYLRAWLSHRQVYWRDQAKRDELFAEDLTASLLAMDPSVEPPPRVLQIEFHPRGYAGYLDIRDQIRAHFEESLDYFRATVLLPPTCNLLGMEERLRPHLAERFLHISVRTTVAESAARCRVLKVGKAWLHSPEQAESLTGTALPVRSWFGPADTSRAGSTGLTNYRN
jgi:hypothetical protein